MRSRASNGRRVVSFLATTLLALVALGLGAWWPCEGTACSEWAILRSSSARVLWAGLAIVVLRYSACCYPLWVIGFGGRSEDYDSGHGFGSMHTGDVVVQSGYGYVCKTIKFWSNSDWSHAGIIVRDPSPELLEQYKVEEVEEGHPQVYVMEALPGYTAQMCSLEQWCRECIDEDGAKFCAAVRHLHVPAEQQEHLHDCFEQELGRLVDVDYNNDHRELMLSIFRLNRVDTCQTLFCSELVVRALQLLGVLQKFVAPNNIVPGDLSGLESEGLVIDDCLLPGFLLGPLTRITHVDYLAASLHERHELTQAKLAQLPEDTLLQREERLARRAAARLWEGQEDLQAMSGFGFGAALHMLWAAAWHHAQEQPEAQPATAGAAGAAGAGPARRSVSKSPQPGSR